MANEIYFNVDAAAAPGLEAKGLRLAAILENEVSMQLADMASIRRTGALKFAGDMAGSGSDAMTMRSASWGAKTPLTGVNEYDDVSATILNASTSTITISRNALRWDLSDLASLTGFGSDIDVYSLAASMAQSSEARINQLVCNTFSAATTSAGVTATALSVDTFFDAQFALELANNFGQIWAILHPRQIGHLIDSLRQETGNAIAFSPATADMLAIRGQGYAGNLLGVEMYNSAYVAKDATLTDYIGMMMSSGGVAYAVGTPSPLVGAGAEIRPQGTPLVVEIDRDAAKGLSSVVAHLYAGSAINQDDMCCKIISSAS